MEAKKIKRGHVSFRLNILFLAVFILFLILILRLGVVQIVHGNSFKTETERTENITARLDAPRGKMFDRYGRVVVSNKPVYSVTFTRTNNTDSEEMYQIAKKLSRYIHKSSANLTKRDRKDFYLAYKVDDAIKLYDQLLTSKEQKELSESQMYRLVIDRLDVEQISLTKEEEEIAAIWREMKRAYSLTPQRIKVGATPKEIAVISEHIENFNGMVDIKPDGKRSYPFGDTFQSIFGQVGQIPRGKVDEYVLNGRDPNDLVGTSFLEKQYESILRGTKTQINYVTDKAGRPVGKPVEIEGSRGNDVVLSLDMELQKKVEKIVEEQILEARSIPDNHQLNSSYVVMMSPQTGEIYSMVGKKIKNGKFQNAPYGNVYHQYPMGSTVKAATVLTGYQTSVIQPGTVLFDTPLKLPGTKVKKSYKNMGYVSDLEALQKSSNVYMFRIAMRMANYDYEKETGFNNQEEAYRTMRYNFNQFGLGVPTGIDLPYEADGYNGGVQALGNLMDMGIGQFDTYTPIQMVQYISTIANGGYRIQPHFLKEVRKPNRHSDDPGKTIYKFKPNILNRVDMKQAWIDHVQKGLKMVMNTEDGTAYPYFKDTQGYVAAGKTGTAEYQGDSYVLSLVGYAPYDNPEVAFAVVSPYAEKGGINNKIGREILDAYFELKRKGHTKNLLQPHYKSD